MGVDDEKNSRRPQCCTGCMYSFEFNRSTHLVKWLEIVLLDLFAFSKLFNALWSDIISNSIPNTWFLKCLTDHTTANSSRSIIECFALNSVKNLDAYAIGFQVFSSFCFKTAPSLYLLASLIIRNGRFPSKCVSSTTFFTWLLTLSNAHWWSCDHSQSASFFRIFLKGKHSAAKSGTNSFNWFTAPRYDLTSLHIVGRNLSVMPCILLFTGDTRELANLNPSHSIWLCAIWHFSVFNCRFAASSVLSNSRTFAICSFFVPLVTIKMSSKK